MGKTLLSLAVTLLMIHGANSQECYNLVWQDEFDYEGKPAADKWGYDVGGNGWGNQELQYYTEREENAKVENGVLTITAKKEKYQGSDYTSARLVTREKGDWLYGKFEIRAKMPEGRGTWPAIWMLPTDWEYGNWPRSGEIDIMEHVGYDQDVVHGTVHTQAYNHQKGTQQGRSILVDNVSTEFHVYSAEWTENKIDFFVNGQKYFTFIKRSNNYEQWPFDKRFHLILNIAIGGTWGGQQGVDDDIFPQTMEVDYVRVYEKTPQLDIQGDFGIKPLQENLKYSIANYPDATDYIWSVPQDATIISGQGTHEINVDWGESEGEVEVQVLGIDSCLVSNSRAEAVFFSRKSNEIKIPIDDFSPSSGSFIELEDGLDVESLGTEIKMRKTSNTSAKITYELESALDMTRHRLLKIGAKCEVDDFARCRITLLDVNGNQTPLDDFHTITVTNSAEYKPYSVKFTDLDFDTGFDPALLKSIRFNFNAQPAVLYINDLFVARTDTLPLTTSNILALGTENESRIWWEDAPNASEYQLVFRPNIDSRYFTFASDIGSHEKPYDINFSSARKFYAIIPMNETGLGEVSSEVSLESLSIKEKRASQFKVIRQGDILAIEANSEIASVELFGMNGKKQKIDLTLLGEEARVIQRERKTGIFIVGITLKNGLRLCKTTQL